MIHHHIENQRIEISPGPNVDLRAINRNLHGLQEEILGIIGELFDRYFPQDTWLEIERIQLDLGSFYGNEFSDELKSRLYNLLNSELATLEGLVEYKELVRQTKTVYQDEFTILEQFLRKGYATEFNDAVSFDLDEWVLYLHARDHNKVKDIFQLLLTDKKSRLRIHHQLKPATIRAVGISHEQIQILKFPAITKKIIEKESEAVLRFFETAEWSRAFSVLEFSGFEKSILLIQKESSEIVHNFLKKNLGNSAVRKRLAKSLSLQTIRYITVQVGVFAKVLKELNLLTAVMDTLGIHKNVFGFFYKSFFLDHLSMHGSTIQKRTEHIYAFLQYQYKTSNKDNEAHFNDFSDRLKEISHIAMPSDEASTFLQQLIDVYPPDLEIETERIDRKNDSPLQVLINYLNTGILSGPIDPDMLFRRLITSHRAALKNALTSKLNLYQLRHRLVYQPSLSITRQLIELLFSDQQAYRWFENILKRIDGAEKGHVEPALDLQKLRHALFAFVELISNDSEDPKSEELFYNQLLMEFSALNGLNQDDFMQWQPPEAAIGQMADLVKRREEGFSSGAEDFNYLQSLLKWGAHMPDFRDHFQGSADIQSFINRIIEEQPEMVLEDFLNATTISESFWSDIAPRLKHASLIDVLRITLPFQYENFEKAYRELSDFEHLYLSREERILPISKEILIVLIKNAFSSSFSISSFDLISTLIEAVFYEKSEIKQSLKSGYAKAFEQLVEERDVRTGQRFFWLFSILIDRKRIEKEPKSLVDKKPTLGIKQATKNRYGTADLVLYYLKTGLFPKWSIVRTSVGLKKIAKQWVKEDRKHAVLRLHSIKYNASAWERMKMIFDASDIQVVFDLQEGTSLNEVQTIENIRPDKRSVDALLNILAYDEMPWWYSSELKEKMGEDSLPVEKKRLFHGLSEIGLGSLIEAVNRTGIADDLIKKLFIYPDKNLEIFYRIVHAMIPEFYGYIVTYVRAIQLLMEKSGTQKKELVLEKYFLFVFRYLKVPSGSFSLTDFSKRSNWFISKKISITNEEIIKQMILISDIEVGKGANRYKVLRSIMDQLLNASPSAIAFTPERMPETTETERISMTVSFSEFLVYYLKNGSLPLEAKYPNEQSFLKAYEAYEKEHLAILSDLLAKELSHTDHLANIIGNVSDIFLLKILHTIAAPFGSKFQKWYNEAVNFLVVGFPEIKQKTSRLIAMRILISFIIRYGPNRVTLHLYVERLLSELSNAIRPDIFERIQAILSKHVEPEAFSKPFIEALRIISDLRQDANIEDVLSVEPTSEKSDDIYLEEKIPLNNAGLVLLGPFLPRYFDMLEMVEKDAFKSKESALRAVHLLQFLATGANETSEHELVLNKILCGLDLDEPLLRAIDLTPREVEVSEMLLNGVLQNWSKLKQSSIQALRDGFLSREGLIFETASTYIVEVKTSGIDILLDYISWSFGHVKLPWMKKFIEVKWR